MFCQIIDDSDWTFTWFRNNQTLDSDSSVSYSENRSVLIITAAAQTHTGSYFCQGRRKTSGVFSKSSDPLHLDVFENQPRLSVEKSPNHDAMFSGESVTFTCSVHPVTPGWSYSWFHNGAIIQGKNSETYPVVSVNPSDAGQYKCTATRNQPKPFTSDESQAVSLNVSAPPQPLLKRVSSWLDVFKGETAELKCELPGSDWTFSWYRNDLKFKDESTAVLLIGAVSENDGGVFSCSARLRSRNVSSVLSNTQTLRVHETTPTPTVSKSPAFNPMYVGETVTFTCSVLVSSGWQYHWYKDGAPLPSLTGSTISLLLGQSDGGRFSCEARRNQSTVTSRSSEINLVVHETPAPRVKNLTSWLDLFPSEMVALTCEMTSGSNWTYTWYRDGLRVNTDETVFLAKDGSTLKISSASTRHKGKYECKGHLLDRNVNSNFSSGIPISVYDGKPSASLKQKPSYTLMFPGESVTFSCLVPVSAGWEYVFYQNKRQLVNTGTTLLVQSVQARSTGSYTCRGKRGTTSVFWSDYSHVIQLEVKGRKPKPLIRHIPNTDKVYSGETLYFVCDVPSSADWTFLWYRSGRLLPFNSRHFQIDSCTTSDSGHYECEPKRHSSEYVTERSNKRHLLVSEIPVPALKNLTQWLDVFPTERVSLSCGMDSTSAWKYTWYRDGSKLPGNDHTVALDSDGTILNIGSASAEHSGEYSCSGTLKSRPVHSNRSSTLTLRVYAEKPNVTLTRSPDYDKLHSRDSVSFTCLVTVSSGWDFLWYKDEKTLEQTTNNYTIDSVEIGSSGWYSCLVKRGTASVFESDHSPTVRLSVDERPLAEIVLLTGWSEVFHTDSLVLSCEVTAELAEEGTRWNYTWFRAGVQIKLSASKRHVVTPHDDPDQSDYSCQGVRSGRPSYTTSSQPLKTRNLLLKRRILLSISGCLFFGLIAVFLGCIVLRFTRKRVHLDEVPEEENLFLTMAQLKDRTDGVNPLTEYLTDKDLTQETTENGTISSETTPLPITTPEDPALKIESNGTEDNDGGMVSFKQ
uniref:Ig-like domain-containing protein n=2 Tax=Cynoglossus semilaevis TaxID=244447 RepID=A0A3P8UGM5_CYNSE